MRQYLNLRTNRNERNLDDQAVLQKVPKPWNMEQKARRHPVIPGVLQKLSKLWNKPVNTGGKTTVRECATTSLYAAKAVLQKLQKPWNKPVNKGVRNMVFHSLFLLLFATTVFAQEKPKAVLLDEFSAIGCEYYTARLSNLFVNLNANPNSRGYVVIRGKGADIQKKLRYELWLYGGAKTYNFDTTRITEVRGPDAGDIKTQFWIVPSGAEIPAFETASWDFTLTSASKPFVFYAESSDTLCTSARYESLYSELLTANPTFRGNIVIYTESLNSFAKSRQAILKKLSSVDRERLRFFYKKVVDFPHVEWWLVPAKKN